MNPLTLGLHLFANSIKRAAVRPLPPGLNHSTLGPMGATVPPPGHIPGVTSPASGSGAETMPGGYLASGPSGIQVLPGPRQEGPGALAASAAKPAAPVTPPAASPAPGSDKSEQDGHLQAKQTRMMSQAPAVATAAPQSTTFTPQQIAQFNRGLSGRSRFNPKSRMDIQNMQNMLSGGNRAMLNSSQIRGVNQGQKADIVGQGGIGKVASSADLGIALYAHGEMRKSADLGDSVASEEARYAARNSARGPASSSMSGLRGNVAGGGGANMNMSNPSNAAYNAYQAPRGGVTGFWDKLRHNAGGGRAGVLKRIGAFAIPAATGILGKMWGGSGKEQAVGDALEQGTRSGMGQGLQIAQQQYGGRGFLDRIMNNDPQGIAQLLAHLQGGGKLS